MLIGSDCGPNSLLGLDDSLQNVVTQTMLNQEEVFRNQLLELHRLYGVQKLLMKEPDLKVSDWESTHSYVGPLSMNSCEHVPTEMNMNQVHMNCSSGYVNNHYLGDYKGGAFKHHRTLLNLELPNSYYANNDSEDFLCNSLTCNEVGQLDLNKALLSDESSVDTIDPWIFKPSKVTFPHVEVGTFETEQGSSCSTVVDWRQSKNNNHSTDSSASYRRNITKSTLKTHDCGSTLCSLVTCSVCRPPSGTEDPVRSCFTKCGHENAETEISLTTDVDRNKEKKHYSRRTTQEQLEGTDSNKSPVLCKSDWMGDDVSSNTKTRQCVMNISKLNLSPCTLTNSVQSSVPKEEESAQVINIMVRMGAVSLLYFSSECLARNQDYVAKPEKIMDKVCNVERKNSQSWDDSYESIVLKQPECSVDEYFVPSAFEVNSLDKKDHGVKLRRGRRMKDFRKEILPALASLSRQEICEDIKVMELAIRSREYKKYGSKNACTSECFSSVSRRRSRLSYAPRR